MTFQKACEQFAGDVGLIGELRILDQLIAEANRRPVHLVVGAARQLNVATPFEAGSVGRPLIPEVLAIVVEIKRMTQW